MPNVNARYRVVEDGAYAAPGICLLCGRHGNSDERGMVDTQKDMDYYGVVYLCSFCVLEIAEQYGAASPSTQLNNLAASEAVQAQLYATRQRLVKAEGVLSGIGALHLLDIDIDSPDSEQSAIEADSQEQESDSFGSDENSTDAGEGEQQQVDESPTVEGPNDFFSTTGSDDEFTLDDL